MTTLSPADWFLSAILSLPILATLLPLIRHNHWLFRIFDFPRVQIAAFSLLCLPLNVWLRSDGHWLFTLLQILNLACSVYQLKEILAYTRLAKVEVLPYNGPDDGNTVSLLTANVLTPNRRADLLLAQIRRLRPDVVLTLESDAWWEAQLDTLQTESDYAYAVKIPLDNLYGMHLYSRLPLENAEVRYWVADHIPSIATHLVLGSGKRIKLFCLHPMPPSPTEADTSTDRDAELLLVGREIQRCRDSVMVVGDLNDVAWSRTSRLFQSISGLLDPRKGRGLYNTFHARYPFLRWPLDHIFHSSDFMVSDIRVLPCIGSDHFPVYGKFQYQPAAGTIQEKEAADAAEQREAAEKIAEAEPLHEVAERHYRR
ncbi:endonuclease/exonuclease/phosphatase family protein [Neisseria leonii]|uniref:endonuclease/exonuclease/phosphatase family protein n=1 Tax=Neisseria leonii TaxID=2995413 RepID=UPI00237B4D9F|nr:endonuclease/exonuclease/phosphatase family protein [Neisseria sp. 3986]MDD9324909.1 endonuclease/exonuclease/phosphatase family protein [Neisseria sp. 3986]